ASARIGLTDQRAHYINPTTSGDVIAGTGFGDLVTITGANGYSATGRAVLDFGPYDSPSRSVRQGIYTQTTYQLAENLAVSGGGNFEHEKAYSDPNGVPTATRDNGTLWVEGRGTLFDRASVTAGLGYAHLEGYASRYSPRLS